MSRANLAQKSANAFLGALLIASLVILLVATPAQAATFDVDRTDDPAAGGNLCTAAANDCSLRGAISLANVATDLDTINIPSGTYTLSIAGTDEDANATGDLDITNDVNITGAGARTTIVDADGIDRAFHTLGDVTQVVISGVTITGGDTSDSGGGLSSESDLTLREVRVDDNQATTEGGGILAFGSTLLIERSTISNNRVEGSGGGMLVSLNSTTIDNSTVANNHADGSGGGIFSFSGGPTLKNSTVADNTADADNDGSGSGGGVNAVTTTATFRNTIVARNSDATSSNSDNCFVGNQSNFISQGFNLEDSDTCNFDQPTDDFGNARLGTLADNGGPTDTLALLEDSPAIDTGNATVIVDQRGIERPQDGDNNDTATDDKGAFELEEEPAPPPTQCSDGTDNDNDGKIDFGGANPDPGCSSADDDSESPDPPVTPPGCTVTGTSGDDNLKGTPGNDTICGLGGNDQIRSNSGSDTVIAGSGNDFVRAGSGQDTIQGGPGDDILQGEAGNDALQGGIGSDRIRGEAGNDSLGAKDNVKGNDTAFGGAGNDTCSSDPGDKELACER